MGRPTDSELKLLDYIWSARARDVMYRARKRMPARVPKNFNLKEAIRSTNISKSAIYRILKPLKTERIIAKTQKRNVYAVIDDSKFETRLSKQIEKRPLFHYPILLKSTCCTLPTCSRCLTKTQKRIERGRQKQKRYRKHTTLKERLEMNFNRLVARHIGKYPYYCYECGNYETAKFLYDTKTGQIVCKKCGLIINMFIPQEQKVISKKEIWEDLTILD